MFLGTATVESYFDNPLLGALSEQMLKVSLCSCEAQGVALLGEQIMSRVTEARPSAA